MRPPAPVIPAVNTMKWVKRLLLLVLFVAVFGVVCALSGWLLSRGTPDWYQPRKANSPEMAVAAENAEKQVQRTLNWAQDQQAYAASSQFGAPTTHPAKTLEISLSEDELNGFFQKWDSTFGWSEHLGPYLADPQIVLRDGHVILAAQVKETGTVMSIEFGAALRDGKLELSIARVLAGRLPLPRTLWSRYQDRLEAAIAEHLPEWRAGANVTPNGAANVDAVAAAMSELLLNGLNDRPSPAVLFLPYSLEGKPRSLPVNVTHLQIANRTLRLDVEPLGPAQRASLLETLRGRNAYVQP